jgi:hypothetical protein
MYKKLVNEQGIETGAIQFIGEGFITTIPPDPANSDYQAFLAWCAEGNEVLPADEVSGE